MATTSGACCLVGGVGERGQVDFRFSRKGVASSKSRVVCIHLLIERCGVFYHKNIYLRLYCLVSIKYTWDRLDLVLHEALP